MWPWSSAATHGGLAEPDICLNMEAWRRRWSAEGWRNFLQEGVSEGELADLRRCTYRGRPWGGEEFVQGLEQRTQRRLTRQKGGRPPQAPAAQGSAGPAERR